MKKCHENGIAVIAYFSQIFDNWVTYGPLTLARDEGKEEGSIESPVKPLLHNGRLTVNQLDAEAGETVRFTVKTEAGDLLLTDYASCGKNWTDERNRISVWLNT